jgi:hypothetical protein
VGHGLPAPLCVSTTPPLMLLVCSNGGRMQPLDLKRSLGEPEMQWWPLFGGHFGRKNCSCYRQLTLQLSSQADEYPDDLWPITTLVTPPTLVPVLICFSSTSNTSKVPPTSVLCRHMHQLHCQFEQWRINLSLRAVSLLVQVCILEKRASWEQSVALLVRCVGASQQPRFESWGHQV